MNRDTRAKTLGISRNRLILEALEEKVGARDEWAPELVHMLGKPISSAAGKGARAQPRHRAPPSYVSQSAAEAVRYVLDTTVVSALMRSETGPSSRLRVDDFDLAIAAQGVVHDAAIVTRNTRHFVRVRSLRVEDWT
jgi:hypothetical protein